MMNFYFCLLLIEFMLIFLMFLPSNLYKFHPLSLGVLLVFYSIFLSIKMSFFGSSYWYSYILFLVMIGGLMILFMYFISLANNQMFMFNMTYYFFMFLKLLFFMYIMYMFMYSCDGMVLFMSNLWMEIVDLFVLDLNNYGLMKNLMMDYLMDVNFYLIMYLFFTMVCSIFLCKKMELPLRQMIKV